MLSRSACSFCVSPCSPGLRFLHLILMSMSSHSSLWLMESRHHSSISGGMLENKQILSDSKKHTAGDTEPGIGETRAHLAENLHRFIRGKGFGPSHFCCLYECILMDLQIA